MSLDQSQAQGLDRLKLAELKSKWPRLLICDQEAELKGFRENKRFRIHRPAAKCGIKIFGCELMRLPVF